MQNWTTPTLGGLQFWTDYRWVAGCRLQKNALTGGWRVLDAKNMRQASGAYAACFTAFERLVQRTAGDVRYEHVVLLMHGLMRTARSMKSLTQFLADNRLGVTIAPSYASSRASISEHANAFRQILEGLPGNPTIDIVAHSMGNIVVRHAIADWQRNGDPSQVVARMKHMVMLGPPNQGAIIAKQLAKIGLFEIITGKGGLELGRDWNDLQQRLATPPFPFAIVAGKVDHPILSNPLVEGESDLIVSVEETHLDGAANEIVVPVMHSFLMDDPGIHQFIADFLLSDA